MYRPPGHMVDVTDFIYGAYMVIHTSVKHVHQMFGIYAHLVVVFVSGMYLVIICEVNVLVDFVSEYMRKMLKSICA